MLNTKDFLSIIEIEAEKNFQIIKTKIRNDQISLKNLDIKREKLEQLIDSFLGFIAEEIAKREILSYIDTNKYVILDYNDIRTDEYMYPDIFDLIIIPKDNNFENIKRKILEISKFSKNIENIGLTVFAKSKEIFKLKEQFKFFTVEIKSSNLMTNEQIQDKPFIAYCKDKYLKNFEGDRFKNEIADISKIGNLYPIEDYFNKIYLTSLSFQEQQSKYLKENVYIKDIHINIFYDYFKDKEFIKKINEQIDFDKIDLRNIITFLPENFYKGFITNSLNLILKNSHIGMTNSKVQAIYHINKIRDIGMGYDKINDILEFLSNPGNTKHSETSSEEHSETSSKVEKVKSVKQKKR